MSSLIGVIPDIGRTWKDSVQYSVGLLQEMDGIVTRNPKDYKEAEIRIWTPDELLSQRQQNQTISPSS